MAMLEVQAVPGRAAKGLPRFAWGVLAYNVLVILWGAYVRATGSGAGCGNHWPLCNGEVIPRAPNLARVIAFSHRVSSGLAMLLVFAMAALAYRLYPKGSPVRKSATYAAAFILFEALIGA